MSYIYCLNCFYNLHGLAEPRCPECGRRFDPQDSRTFSDSPSPETFSKVMQRVALAINETVRQLSPRDEAAIREIPLRRRVSMLEQENAALRVRLEALLQVLTDQGVLTPEQSEAVLAAAPPTTAEALERVVDDSESNTREASGDGPIELGV